MSSILRPLLRNYGQSSRQRSQICSRYAQQHRRLQASAKHRYLDAAPHICESLRCEGAMLMQHSSWVQAELQQEDASSSGLPPEHAGEGRTPAALSPDRPGSSQGRYDMSQGLAFSQMCLLIPPILCVAAACAALPSTA